MSIDTELETWRREWRSGPAAGPDLALRVRRQSLYMRLMLFTEVLVTLGMGGGAIGWAVRSPQSDVVVLAIAIWIFLGAAWTFGLKNRSDCWTPAAMTTAAFLDISMRRCQAAIASCTFAALLYASEVVFCLGWIYHRKSQAVGLRLGEFLASPLLVAVYLGTVAFAAAIWWYRRRKRAELAFLLELRLADTPDDEVVTERLLSSRRFRRVHSGRRKRFGRV